MSFRVFEVIDDISQGPAKILVEQYSIVNKGLQEKMTYTIT